jgi:hypothetical protein
MAGEAILLGDRIDVPRSVGGSKINSFAEALFREDRPLSVGTCREWHEFLRLEALVMTVGC